MKAGIIDNQSRSEFWDDLLGDSFDCVVAADISKLPDCDIILVSEEYSGGSIDTLIGNLMLIRNSIENGDRRELTRILHKAKLIKEELGE